MVRELTNRDKKEINEKFPSLNCEIKKQKIWGTLNFCCYYDKDTKKLEHNSFHPNRVEDSYEIEILFTERGSFDFPKVYETSEKIERKEDFHINIHHDNSCCLGIFPEYQWTSAYHFIIEKVVPFFYWQTVKRETGKEPWVGYSHGNEGLKEAMILDSAKGADRNKLCPCGSKIKYKKCCMKSDNLLRQHL